MDVSESVKVWQALARGEMPERPGVALLDGRIDLRGFEVPRSFYDGERVTIRGVTWTGLDLSGAQLVNLSFFDCVFENCNFQKARCEGWRFWGSIKPGPQAQLPNCSATNCPVVPAAPRP